MTSACRFSTCLVLQLCACHGHLFAQGRVVDEHGAPVAGARISVIGPGLRGTSVDPTNAQGCFDYGSGADANALYSIRFDHPQYQTVAAEVRSGSHSLLVT